MLLVEASEIVKNLWQGSFPRPGREVRASGFSLLVLCAHELQEPASSYPDVEVVHAPNYDDDRRRLNRERLELAVMAARKVTKALQNGRKVLVTCAAGLNRSGLVTGLALHMYLGWEGADCVDMIRKKRGERHGLQPLCNPDFERALLKLSRTTAQRTPTGWRETSDGLIVPV